MRSDEAAKKFRDMSVEELRRQEANMKEQMFKLRFQWAMGQTETLNKLRQLRKDRARMLTVMQEKAKSK